MPDVDQANKTEPPSPKKLQDAFEKGNFPRSPEIGTFAILAATYTAILFAGQEGFERLMDFARILFAGLADVEISHTWVVSSATSLCNGILSGLSPIFLSCFSAALIAGGLQSGFKITPKAIEAKFDKLNPMEGLKRNFSLNSLVRSGMDLLKLGTFMLIVIGLCKSRLQDPIFQSPSTIQHLAQFMADTTKQMFKQLLLVMAGIAILHYAWTRFDHMRKMRMSRQEVKDEMKQMEGDPYMKAKLRQMGLRLAQKQMLGEVPFADVVITNPTHYAVALRYVSGQDQAPIVLAKGKNRFAQRIKAVAAEHDVPRVENRPAAQALYKLGAVGQPIPAALYKVVAAILGHVYREHRYYFFRLRSRREAYARRQASEEVASA